MLETTMKFFRTYENLCYGLYYINKQIINHTKMLECLTKTMSFNKLLNFFSLCVSTL